MGFRMGRSLRLGVTGLAFMPLLSGGCGELYAISTAEARARFVEETSCPSDRVSVTERPDLDHETLVRDFGSGSRPPADVAADPARLRIWRNTQRAESLNHRVGFRVFEFMGCGAVKSLYACYRWHGGVSCEQVALLDDGPDPGGETRQPKREEMSSDIVQAFITSVLEQHSGAESQTSVTVVAFPEILDRVAAQLDAAGQTAAAEKLRARAAELRDGGPRPP